MSFVSTKIVLAKPKRTYRTWFNTANRSQTCTRLEKKLDILWGIHQGGSDNLDSSFESRVKYLGLQVDFGLRQKVRPNFTMNYWFDYEQRALDSEGSKKGGFTIDGSDHKYLLRYAISAHYRFNS